MIKVLAYGLAVCATLSVLVVTWLTIDGGPSGQSLTGVFWGIVLFALVLEPLLMNSIFAKRLRSLGYSALFVRATFSGAIIFGLWACSYYVGVKLNRYEFVLILVGYGLALVVGILGVVFLTPVVEQNVVPNGTPAASVDNANASGDNHP